MKSLFFTRVDRWNSWNFFACNINETVIKETGILLFLLSWFFCLCRHMLSLFMFLHVLLASVALLCS
jgi:hypothetical protein